MARDLSQTGQFTNGIFADDPGAQPKPGRFFAPAYPMLISLVSRLDPGLASWVSCHAAQPYVDTAVCPGSAQTLFAVQVLMAAVGMACIFSIALNLSGSPLVAWIAMLMTLATGQPALYAKTYLSENPSFLAFYLFLASLVAAVARRNHWMLGAAGASLALAALSRPSYLYLYYAVIAALALLALARPPRNLGFSWRSAALFAAAGLAVLAPWLLRNFLMFGDPSLTSGYGGFILAQRLAYNQMSWQEWGAYWIVGLPDFGDRLAAAILPKSAFVRFDYGNPSSFYLLGNGKFMADTLAAAGGRENHLHYLLQSVLLPDLIKHVAVTLPMTMSGMWPGKYLALLAVVWSE